jgi:branched-chain amino acid aminotransferase
MPEFDQYTTLDEVSLFLPQGVYTTFRTYSNKSRVVGLQNHLDRLQDSARSLGWNERIDYLSIRNILRALLSEWRVGECRVRITLDLTNEPGSLYFSIANFVELATEIFERGVRVRISNRHRILPEAKKTSFIRDTQDLKAIAGDSVFEWIIVENQKILEGITSNFFAVRNQQVFTADRDVLKGVTRAAILVLAEKLNIPVNFEPIPVDDLASYQEAFITSSSRGVVPVIQLDEQLIGDGLPGHITRQLQNAYWAYLETAAELI